MKQIALCPGSYDPITKGHEHIIERTSKKYDLVYVGIGINPNKKDILFSPEERVKLIEKVVEKYKNVKVVAYDCFTVEIAEKLGAKTIVKGIRNIDDAEYELEQAKINYQLNKNIETSLIVSYEEYNDISSTKVKELARQGKNFKELVPEEIYDEIKDALNKRK